MNEVILTSLVLVLIVIALCFLTARRKGLPPGPPGYPIIGNLGQFEPKDSLKVFRVLRKQYGDIFCFFIFHKPVIVVNGYDWIREVLFKQGDIFSYRPTSFFTEAISHRKGLVGSSGEFWKVQRTFALTTMRNFGFGKRSLESQIVNEIERLIKVIEKQNGSAFDVQKPVSLSVSNIICSMTFGKRFDYDDQQFKRLLHAINEMLASISEGSPVAIFPFLRHLPCDLFKTKRILKNVKEIVDFIQANIEEHKKTLDENDIRDYIDAFLVAQREHENEPNTTFTDDQLLHTVRDFFVAGTETTTTTLRWAFLFLLHNPDIQSKLHREIDVNIGEAKPRMEHKAVLPFCEAFCLEVQRVGNIAPIALQHSTNEDNTLNGFVFPKDVIILPILDSVMFDPEVFPDPHTFHPDRFIDENGKCGGQQKDKMIPFSTGRRICLGESLAKMEIFLFVVVLLQRYLIQPENPKCLPSLEGNLGITNMPNPFKLRMVKR